MTKIKQISVATVSIMAFLAVISESQYFPWSNIAGLMIMAVIVFVVQHVEETSRWKRYRRIYEPLRQRRPRYLD